MPKGGQSSEIMGTDTDYRQKRGALAWSLVLLKSEKFECEFYQISLNLVYTQKYLLLLSFLTFWIKTEHKIGAGNLSIRSRDI